MHYWAALARYVNAWLDWFMFHKHGTPVALRSEIVFFVLIICYAQKHTPNNQATNHDLCIKKMWWISHIYDACVTYKGKSEKKCICTHMTASQQNALMKHSWQGYYDDSTNNTESRCHLPATQRCRRHTYSGSINQFPEHHCNYTHYHSIIWHRKKQYFLS